MAAPPVQAQPVPPAPVVLNTQNLSLFMPLLHEVHPTYDPADRHSVTAYFEDLELLFRRHQIVHAAEKKHFACKYGPDGALWSSLTDYANAATYDGFKNAVLGLYPSLYASDAGVNELIQRWEATPIDSYQRYMAYYRELVLFVNMRMKEAQQPRLVLQASQWLLKPLPEWRRAQIQRILEQTPSPRVSREFTIAETHKAAVKAYLLPSEDRTRASEWHPGRLLAENNISLSTRLGL